MALSREEIEEIAESVAIQVVRRVKACRCGYATWRASDELNLLENFARAEQVEGILASGPYATQLMGDIEDYCGIDMRDAGDNFKNLQEFARPGSWGKARDAVQALRKNVGDGLYTCAKEEED